MGPPIAGKFPSFLEDNIPVELHDMRDILICMLLKILVQINVERFSERSEGITMTLIMDVNFGIVDLKMFRIGDWTVDFYMGSK